MKKYKPAASGPRPLGSLVNQLLSRRGYAQVMAGQELQAVLEAEVGQQLAGSVRVGNLKRGILHIYIADSVTHQELQFRKRALLNRFQQAQPSSGITDLRFHVSASI
jgi:hypothetical protein